MFTIEKITVSYDAEEDRLHLAVSDAQQQALGLWLTRRLANQLVGVLLGELAESDTPLTDAYVRAAIQAWEQAAANAQLKPLTPVRGDAVLPTCLATSVDVMQAVGYVGLVFQVRESRPASLTLSHMALRQWLGIVHILYKKAEWPCEGLWPDWITGETKFAPSAIAADILH
ncbi:hypothetical protein BJN34_21655 [Cupriavidus necator]|uniref:Uncharacterized protein n=1 Tax=Cupriavidus necator TaxID=106590 RepID=A0A1U9UVM2_CUPNE|nr:hypothetical protein [Cupriavidus necator]AQV96477.1 hypothetical protein BJN34_21655 [Cupriavidus necator]